MPAEATAEGPTRSGRIIVATRPGLKVALAALALGVMVIEATAHASDRGHILFLPTAHYLIGGALAVTASFIILAVMPTEPLDRLLLRAWRIAAWHLPGRTLVSLLSFCAFTVAVLAGWWGTRDPLANPLPLAFWTLLWTGLVIVQGLFGNLWSWINPWYGPYRVVCALLSISPNTPFLPWPAWLSFWPAFSGLAAFAWFELVYPAPDDPGGLADVIFTYWSVSLLGMMAFGYRQWAGRGEFLTLFMAMIARLSPLQVRGSRLYLTFPGAGIVNASQLSVSGAAFLLLALSTVTFDGFRHTFRWLALIGVNPLEFPGRSAGLCRKLTIWTNKLIRYGIHAASISNCSASDGAGL